MERFAEFVKTRFPGNVTKTDLNSHEKTVYRKQENNVKEPITVNRIALRVFQMQSKMDILQNFALLQIRVSSVSVIKKCANATRC